MSEKIIVSVCCITYNQAEYIETCIASILSQEFPFNFEIIIADDCSTDDTRKKLAKLASGHSGIIKIIYNDKNLGPNGNVLSVLSKATGEYITFCEGDDYWIDNCKLLTQYNAMKNHPNVNFCFHRAFMETNGVKFEHFNYGNRQKIFYPKDVLKIVGQFAPTASYMFKRNVVNKLPNWFSKCSVGDLFLELYSMDNGGLYLPRTMSVYRVNAKGSWSEAIKNDIDQFIERHKNIAYYLNIAKNDFPDCLKEFDVKIANVYLNMCTRFIFEKRYDLFRLYLKKANAINRTFTVKQKLYNKFIYFPQCLYFIHYLKSFIRK